MPESSAPVSDSERSAPVFTAYDLTLQFDPASAHMSALARLTLRNGGEAALQRVALQISSSLMWESAAFSTGETSTKLAFTQHRLATDADHTGAVSEMVAALPRPLAPGATADFVVFYSGTLARTAERLESFGAPTEDAEHIEWDRVAEDGTFLRGFGNVLWYPAASPAFSLGDGAALAQAASEQKLQQQHATMRLRLTTTYATGAPEAVYFCGRRGSVSAVSENAQASAGSGPGLATAEFAAEPLGFQVPSLFVLPRGPVMAGRLLDVVTETSEAKTTRLETTAGAAEPLLTDWLGVSPLRRLTVVEQSGQSFTEGAFVVAPPGALLDQSAMTTALAHAWFRSRQPWLDEGVAQWMALLGLERASGREAALAQLGEQTHALSLAESIVTGAAGEPDESLLHTGSDVLLRNKAVAVLWMLRAITGDDALKQALQRVRADAVLDDDPHGFERALEQTSGKPLGWFFADWVDHDRGVPDLTITSVAARPLTGRGGDAEGSLVAVEVHNAGGAVAEVPVTVRAGALTATERVRVAGRGSASVRVLFQGIPDEVQVNDGTVPELVSSVHVRRVVAVGP